MRPEIPPLTEDEIHELLAEDAWAQRNMLEGFMDDKHAHADHAAADAMRQGCVNTRGALNLGRTGWDFTPEPAADRSSWWLVALGAAATVFAVAMLKVV